MGLKSENNFALFECSGELGIHIMLLYFDNILRTKYK